MDPNQPVPGQGGRRDPYSTKNSYKMASKKVYSEEEVSYLIVNT